MNIVNWDKVFKESDNFKTRSPTKWVFVEEFLNRDFYEKLQKSYPKFDNDWEMEDSYDKVSYRKYWKVDDKKNILPEKDERYSDSWNEFMAYAWSEDFCKKLAQFTDVSITNLKHFGYMLIKKNGFQLPHIHNVSDKTLLVLLYFSKNWEEGDPGATYLSKDLDEKNMVFEPYNLDNTALIVLDGPNAAHGARKISKDVERKAIQLTYEPYSATDGWYGSMRKDIPELLDL